MTNIEKPAIEGAAALQESRPSLGSLLWYFGYDVFISYSRLDGSNYALALQQKLASTGLQVFLDTNEIPDGTQLPSMLSKALERSSTLVILVTQGACSSAWVRKEADLFLKNSRMLVPIVTFPADLDTSSDDISSPTGLKNLVSNYTWITDAGLSRGMPAEETVQRIINSVGVMRRSRRLAAFWTLVSLLFALIASLSIAFYLKSQRSLTEVTSQQLAAEAQLASEDKPDLAALLAIQSYKTKATAQAKNSLLSISTHPLPVQRYLRGHAADVITIAANANVQQVVSGDLDGVIRVWNPAGDTLFGYELRKGDQLSNVAISDNGIISAAYHSRNIVIKIPGKKEINLPPPAGLQSGSVMLAWSGSFLIAAYSGFGFVTWSEIDSRWEISSITSSAQSITAFEASSDGNYIAATFGDTPNDQWANIYSVSLKGELLLARTFPLYYMQRHNMFGVRALALSSSGNELALVDDEERMRFYELTQTGEDPIITCQPQKVGVAKIHFSGNGQLIYSAALDGQLRLIKHDKSQCSILEEFTANSSGLQSIAVLSMSKRDLLFTGAGDNSIVVWSFAKSAFTSVAAGDIPGYQMQINLNLTNSKLFLASNDLVQAAEIREYKISSNEIEVIGKYPAPRPVTGITTFMNTEDLLMLARDGLYKMDSNSNGWRPVYSEPGISYWYFAQDKNRKRFALISIFGEVTVLDEKFGVVSKIAQTKQFPLNRTAALSSDGAWLATGAGMGNMASQDGDYNDGRIFLFDLHHPQKPPTVLNGHRLAVLTLKFDKNNRLFSGSADGKIMSWDVNRSPFELVHTYSDAKGSIQTLSLNDDASLLAAGTEAGSYVYVWDLQTDSLMRGFKPGIKSMVTASTFDALSRLYVADESGRVTRWEIDFDRIIDQLCSIVGRPFHEDELQRFTINHSAPCQTKN